MTDIHHANGGTPHQVCCHYCNAPLGRERVAAPTGNGTRFFCAPDKEYPMDACYLLWRRSHH